jgi:GNAT superfamily N-acetyltransferase
VRIRRAEPADSVRATEIAHAAKSHWSYPAEWIVEWRSQLTLTPEYIVRERVFVAVSDDIILGVCAIEERGSHWSLEHMWVDPQAHGKGVGRALVEHALRVASDERPLPMHVESDPFAVPFYEHLGARRIGEVKAPVTGDPDRVLPLLVLVSS